MKERGEEEQEPSPSSNVALIVGVTGMVGLSLARTLHPSSTSWTVFGLARRPPNPNTLIPLHGFIQLNVLDRPLTLQTLSPLAHHVTHLFWVTFSQEEDDVDNSRMLTNVLDSLLTSSSATSSTSALRHVSLQTGTKHYYWAHLSNPSSSSSFPINQLVPFKETLPRNNPCKLFYYDLEDILVNYSRSRPSMTWTVHRASIILGASCRSFYNVLLTLAVFALICRYERAPLLYPGSAYTWHHFCDVSDADLVAEQHVWAGTTPAAKFEAFNCANGDLFTWRSFWKVLCEIFDVEFVEYCRSADVAGPSNDWVGRMEGKGGVWDEIVREEGLHVTKLEEITCFGAVYCILNFDFQHVSCMNKSREFGFVRSVDSLKSVRKWVQRLGEMNVIPKVG